MANTLRNRLILSHIIPSLIIIPLLVGVMFYVVENRVLLPIVYKTLAADARLMAEISRNQEIYWIDRAAAQLLVDGASPFLSGSLTLLTPNGRLLASDVPGEAALAGQIVEMPRMTGVEQGDIIELQRGTSAEVYTPVINDAGQLLGVVSMATRVVSVREEIYQVRYLFLGMVVLAVLAGVLLGSYLAVVINRPIQRVTQSIQALSDGDWSTRLEEMGFEETRILARTVNALVDRLHSMEKSRKQLLANLVHELGRPLGAFHSAIQALQKGASNDPQLSKELLAGMDGETTRLRRLLDDLAELYEQVLGTLELYRTTIEVNTWLSEVLAPWEAAALHKQVGWERVLDERIGEIYADPDRLAQALSNLVSNAVKFTPKGGHIQISTVVEGNWLGFQVEDNGPGIPPDELKVIFQPFFRGSQGRRIVQGMGLGLSIAQDIAVAHGGKIEVESEMGVGSQFTLWLPAGSPWRTVRRGGDG